MSAQGGTLRAPVNVPIRGIVATLLAAAFALGIGLGVRELVEQPARSGGSVAVFDWGTQPPGEPPGQIGFQSHQQI